MKHRKKTALVIGGGQGIGAAVCRQIVERTERGVTQLIIGQRSKPAEEFIQSLSAAGVEVRWVELDLTSASSRERFVSELPSILHYLIHCAGVCPREPFTEMTEAIWDQVLAVNLKGPLFLTQALFPRLQAAAPASVCFVSSLAGRIGGRGSSVAYSASKAGVDAAMKALAKVGGARVTCFSVAPGPTNTSMMSELPAKELDAILASTLTGRICEPDEVAGVIVDMLDRRAVTGQVIDLNNGVFLD